MAFQIKDKQNNPISINKIDEEVAEFWGQEVHPKAYACPLNDGQRTMNWFDVVGYSIHSGVKWTSGWEGIKCRLLSFHTDDLALKSEEDQIAALKSTNKYLKPYMELIDYFKTKGYQFETLKDK